MKVKLNNLPENGLEQNHFVITGCRGFNLHNRNTAVFIPIIDMTVFIIGDNWLWM